MVREDLKTRTPLSKKILGFAIINIIPLGALGWFIWALWQGRVSLDDLPEGLDRNGVHLGVTIALLFLVVTFLLPSFHFIASGLRRSLRRSAEIRGQAGFFRLVWELILWPPRQLFYVIFWVLRFALFVVSFALIAAAILFIIRFFEGDFGEAWLPVDDYLASAEAWVTGR